MGLEGVIEDMSPNLSDHTRPNDLDPSSHCMPKWLSWHGAPWLYTFCKIDSLTNPTLPVTQPVLA